MSWELLGQIALLILIVTCVLDFLLSEWRK